MKTVMITGANSGLGFEAAKKTAMNRDFKVILACRNEEKANTARETIIRETGNENVEVMKLDVSSLDSVRACAETFRKSGQTLDVLVNNAGISAMGNSGFTPDGFEIVFETNYLGAFCLTRLLIPSMSEDAAIYNITSDMHNPPGGLEWPDMEAIAHPQKEDRHKYSYSKLCMIYFTHEQAKRFQEEGKKITINAFNPGFMGDTNFTKGSGKIQELMVKKAMPERYGKLSASSDALAELITNPYNAINGEYFDRSTKTARSSDLSYNEENAEELWHASIAWCGLKEQ